MFKLTLSDIIAESPSLSIREGRERLTAENEHRDDLLQKARHVRSKIISGKAINETDLKMAKKTASLGVLPSTHQRHYHTSTSPVRSIRSGLEKIKNEQTSTVVSLQTYFTV